MTFFSNETSNPLRILKECIAVGLLAIGAGYIASYIVKPYTKVSLPDICKNWNEKKTMEWSLFVTGFLVHLALEMLGINKSYANYRSLLP